MESLPAGLVPNLPSRANCFSLVLFRQIGGSMQNNTGFAVPLLGTQSPKKTRWLRKKGTASAPFLAVESGSESVKTHLPYGICLSGGGIRAAAFSLGVLERIQKEDMLVGDQAARYLSCVSGGSYMGTALTMLSKGPFPGEPHQDPAEEPSEALPGYAPESPEVTFLRDNTKYLTHGWGGLPVAIWRLLLGIFWNFTILVMGLLLVAVPIGWLYGWALPSLRAYPPPGGIANTLSIPSAIFWWALGIAGVAILIGLVWVAAPWTQSRTRQTLVLISLIALGLVVAGLLVVVVAPITLEWIRHSFEGSAGPSSTAGAGSSATATAAASGSALVLSGLSALLGARVVRTADSWWNQIPEADRSKLLNRAWHWVLSHRGDLLNLLAWLIGPATILAISVFGFELGALYAPGFGPGYDSWLAPVVYAVGAVVLGLVWLFADITAWSLHPFYRERLSNAFVLKRFKLRGGVWSPTAVKDGDDRVDAHPRSYDFEYKVSEAQRADMPELVVCASANVSRYGAAPTGARVCSFVFSSSLIGGRVIGGFPAREYEETLKKVPHWRRTITAPGAMAISGAAVSPEMGRMTHPALRFLLTMANVRLGVWVPNPNRLNEFRARADNPIRRLRLRPRVSYLLREMFGLDDPQNMFLYVTDGGHYENEGLIELVRRRCKYIWCVDASGDQQGTFSTLAGALRLAQDELGIEIDIYPTIMAPDPAVTKTRDELGLPPVVQRTFCVGNIKYPDGDGRLVVIKAGVPADAPYGIADFYNSNRAFPCDSTLDQLYTAQRFDAYRDLGNFAADQAVSGCAADFSAFRASGGIVPNTFLGDPAALATHG